jgi:NAD-dependent SIR2 family protein deacetylase
MCQQHASRASNSKRHWDGLYQVLFLGAGVSASAGLPLWGELLAKLAQKVHMTPEEIAELKKISFIDQARICMSATVLRNR